MKSYYYLFLMMEQHKFGMLRKAVVSLTLEIMYQGNVFHEIFTLHFYTNLEHVYFDFTKFFTSYF